MEYIGYWKLPNTTNEITGVLKYKDDMIVLELLGSFDSFNLDINHMGYDIINGFTQEGKDITLCNCFIINQKINFPGIIKQTLKVNNVLIGRQILSMEDLKISKVIVTFDYLNNWIEESEAKILREDSKITFIYEKLNKHIYKLKKKSINISFEGNIKYDPFLTDLNYNQKTFVEIIFDESKSYFEAINEVYNFKDFMAMCIGKRINYVELKMETEKKEILDIINKKNLNLKAKTENFSVKRPLIMYQDIKNDFGVVYSKWLELQEKLQPIIDKILECDEKERTFDTQIHFMNIITAIEVFSRRFMNNCKEPQENYEKKIKFILDSIENQEYNKWLEGKLRYANEPTLSKRLKNIFKETKFLVDISSKYRETISFKIVELRNYYTHFGQDKTIQLTPIEQFRIYEYLKLVLKILIFKQLSINVEEIIIKNESKYRELRAIKNFKECFSL
ncbi:HEPN domain-containing protein [Clostridium perfringens]